ncbi:glycosyltransferase [Methanobacterium formicicum]|uniref:Glycosyl transferase group 1 n=1 Tax=Methanobacterium formicicum (strain DSM 3637 / PP1) TaxID=1204725 RepID=K2RDR3_METFP|nr:glycosyltransferase [Methanobacterium formicicum]EKF86484.1 glycosyl transferase group 1 [Methanobacterium formicicum DSM 3637]
MHPGLKKICEDLEIETIIAVSEVSNFHAVLSRWLFGNKVRIILSQHMNPEIFLDSPSKFRLIKFFYPRADKVVCVSKEVERILNDTYGISNTLTIYNMMDIEKNIQSSLEELPEDYNELFKGKIHEFKGKTNENGKIEEETFNFINVGRLTRQKGHWFLIRSFRQVVDKHQNARLFILGEGNLREKLEDLILELDLSENVFLLGDQENVFPFLANSDCFVFSSLWEGLPLSLIEAITVNLPVISADCKTGPREVLCPEFDFNKTVNYPYLGEHAILTKPFHNELLFKNLEESPLNESEKMLSELMIKIIKDPDFKEKYSNTRELADNFSYKKIIKEWDGLL